MMLVWNNLADPHLSAFLHFAWFSRTVTLKTRKRTESFFRNSMRTKLKCMANCSSNIKTLINQSNYFFKINRCSKKYNPPRLCSAPLPNIV